MSVGAESVAGLSVDNAALTVKLLENLVPEIAQDVSALKLAKTVSKPLVTELDKATAARRSRLPPPPISPKRRKRSSRSSTSRNRKV